MNEIASFNSDKNEITVAQWDTELSEYAGDSVLVASDKRGVATLRNIDSGYEWEMDADDIKALIDECDWEVAIAELE